jgi:hypothetical protein
MGQLRFNRIEGQRLERMIGNVTGVSYQLAKPLSRHNTLTIDRGAMAPP